MPFRLFGRKKKSNRVPDAGSVETERNEQQRQSELLNVLAKDVKNMTTRVDEVLHQNKDVRIRNKELFNKLRAEIFQKDRWKRLYDMVAKKCNIQATEIAKMMTNNKELCRLNFELEKNNLDLQEKVKRLVDRNSDLEEFVRKKIHQWGGLEDEIAFVLTDESDAKDCDDHAGSRSDIENDSDPSADAGFEEDVIPPEEETGELQSSVESDGPAPRATNFNIEAVAAIAYVATKLLKAKCEASEKEVDR